MIFVLRLLLLSFVQILMSDLCILQFENQGYLLNNMKVLNFMPFIEFHVAMDYDTIQFVSNQADGKSSSIIAALVGLGYDILVENHTPTGFCGWELRGKNICKN